jgi:DNA (cytosine-5)-methyltransferase 1
MRGYKLSLHSPSLTKPAIIRMLCAIDLCSGPGGVTEGYKAAGIQVLAAADIDANARATYTSNHPEVEVFSHDLLRLSPVTLLDRLALAPGELDILTACVPCQTYSTLGRKYRRSDDRRNRLVHRVGEFVAVLKPRAVVMENVPPLADNLRFKRLVARLRRLGYGVWFGVVDAADFGVPQRRHRLVMIALEGWHDKDVPPLSSGHPLLRESITKQTVADALSIVEREASADDPLAKAKEDYSPLVARRIAAIPHDGGSRASLPLDLKLACHTSMRTAAAGNVYGRMRLNDVAPTLTTRCTTPSCGRFLHPVENRAISLREAACLQTFPVDYVFKGGRMSIESQIGNAVPPRLARAIAVVVADALDRLPRAPDASSSETRRRMQRVRRRDTPAERELRSALHRRGLRFRVDAAPLPSLRRRADVVFKSSKVAVFVDGCFWHGCPLHCTWPQTNAHWWKIKIARNRRRDADTDQQLANAGWLVVRAWEHEDLHRVAQVIVDAVSQRRPSP